MMSARASYVVCERAAHRHSDEETSDVPTLVLPCRGVFRYHVDDRTAIADANTVLLFHPDRPYRISHPTDEGDVCLAVRLDADALADALGAAGCSAGAWIPHAAVQRALHRCAERIAASDDAFERDGNALDVAALIGGNAKPVMRTADRARIDSVREQLASDPGAALSFAQVASGVGYSPFHFARRFRALTGTSVHQYRLALRLQVARARIQAGEDRMTTLAHDLGFASLAHFSTSYKRAFGTAPTVSAAAAAREMHRSAFEADAAASPDVSR